ncbi:ABC-2 family transporter protein [Gluconacetobacter azotocaptans]|uniref:ABC transporter permease n=1 Tax=Gluconacetobacter azotocaptans TaxID=142834 RepID=UPI001959F12B|nr:ABC-2 family transporter protein [Gluconacetobacter azotocaptans]MBM9400600.1 ABC-2 family transporter protein [Gluconacetobacter azotocaptans]
MTAYLSAFRARWQVTSQYRAAALAGIVTQIWWGAINIMVYAAFYDGAHPAPLNLNQTISYVWIMQGTLALMPWGCDPDIADAVRSGAMAHDLLRPVDPWWWWFCRAAARILGRLVPRALLMAGFAGIVLPLAGLDDWALHPPPAPADAALFAASIVLGLVLSACITVLLNVATVRTLSPLGANAVITPLSLILSGNMLPLALFPAAAQHVLLLQPFAGLGDLPCRFWLGTLQGPWAAAALAQQIAWIVALTWGGRLALRRTLWRLEVQGG